MMNDSPDLKQDLQLGALLEKFKRFDKAECIYRSIIEQHPTDFRAYFNCAQILASDELRLAEAYTLFAKVIELDESVIETYGSIAAVLIKQHRPREAVYYCETGLGKNPQNRTCLYNLNVSLRQLNSIYAAICRSWKALISIDPLVIHNTERESSIAQVPAQNRVAPTSIGTTVVCVKWGKKYGANYVNNLYHALMRHQPSDERCRTNKMVCFTDDTTGIDPAVVCEPFAVSTAKWHGWWLKAQVFARHPQLTGWLLYIDLDTVISSPLDFLAPLLHAQDKSEDNQVPPETLFNGPNNEILRNQSAKFYTLAAEHFQNEGRTQGINSSMMLWHTDNVQFHTLYGFLQNHYSALLCVIYKFDHYLEMMLYKHLARCGAQLSPAVKAEDVKALSFPSTIDGTSTQGGLLGQDVVLMDDIDGLRDSPSIVTFSHVSDIEQPACPQDTLSELTTASQLPDASSYTDDVFCIYIQDICPGAVVDYFALRETLLSSSGGDSGEGALVGTAADGESRANVIRKSNNNYYDIKGVTYVPSVVCFPLKPKPHELVEDAWVQQHWQGVQGGGES